MPIADATADEKVNKWNKNALVWFPLLAAHWFLDELLPAALSVFLPRPSFCRSLLRLLWCSPLVVPTLRGCPSTRLWELPRPISSPLVVERWIQFEEGLSRRVGVGHE